MFRTGRPGTFQELLQSKFENEFCGHGMAICVQHRFQSILLSTLAGALLLGATPSAGQGVPPPPSGYTGNEQLLHPHMQESLRTSIGKVIVISGSGPAGQAIDGTYEKATEGLVGGIDAGSRMGRIGREIGGVPIYFPIPGTALPGAIFGGIRGLARREIQEFRDALTEQLADAESTPLKNEGLAIDVFWAVRRLPSMESHLFSPNVELPSDADAVLYVSFGDLNIDVQGKDAVITTKGTATVHRISDSRNIYQTTISYQDRDTLSNWTKNDNALWREYINYARYYLGRELSADVFDRVLLEHKLEPVATDTAKPARKDPDKLVTESTLPTLSWQLELAGGDPYGGWSSSIDEADIRYDIEIFDNQQLVYDARDLDDPIHRLAYDLEPCRTYRWTVRPSYNVDGATRFGEWMQVSAREDSKKKSKKKKKEEQAAALPTAKGILGRQASAAPAYTQDFARLEVACPR